MTKTLIENGKVYDAESHTFQKRNVLIDGNRIVSIDNNRGNADVTFDATDVLVTPGLIDLHCHIFNHPEQPSRLPADRIGTGQGVTCLLDTGSTGGDTLDEFRELVVESQKTHTFALCNIGSPGKHGPRSGHAAKPELVSIEKTVRAIERNRDYTLGVKVLASSSHTGLMGIEAVKMARKAAEITGTPLMAHIGNAPPVIDDILDLLRPGDIVTHAYHGKAGGVLGFDNQVIPAFKAAVERGVHVDIAHGRSSFSFRTCETALEQGMPVHSISSDLHRGNIEVCVLSLARTMSKFRLLGLSLEDIVLATTYTPACAVGLDEHGFGKLEVGGTANVSLIRETEKAVEVEDADGERRTTQTWIEPVGCIVDGSYFRTEEPI
jgi:dihydroorotase